MKVNDILAILLLVLVIPALWIMQGNEIIELPGEVNGVLISVYTLIIQYYFRKKPDNGKTTEDKPK